LNITQALSDIGWFQTNPRGVGGIEDNCRAVLRLFQTNPRGVGGTDSIATTMGRLVSDQPSWGRRAGPVYLAYSNYSGFRPTLVGSEGM